jgi:hypothetical protein
MFDWLLSNWAADVMTSIKAFIRMKKFVLKRNFENFLFLRQILKNYI